MQAQIVRSPGALFSLECGTDAAVGCRMGQPWDLATESARDSAGLVEVWRHGNHYRKPNTRPGGSPNQSPKPETLWRLVYLEYTAPL